MFSSADKFNLNFNTSARLDTGRCEHHISRLGKRIWRQETNGGEPKRLQNSPEEKLYANGLSPDGKQFAFTRGGEIRDLFVIKDAK
ncbi:MAG: hypothetical protein ABI954_06210 [Pyrinomonadaceae bacterium]